MASKAGCSFNLGKDADLGGVQAAKHYVLEVIRLEGTHGDMMQYKSAIGFKPIQDGVPTGISCIMFGVDLLTKLRHSIEICLRSTLKQN